MSHRRHPLPDYYATLGVLTGASLREITSAYHLLACKLHPDVAAEGAGTRAQFKRVNEAYQVLSNPHRRSLYDLARARRARHPRPSSQQPRKKATPEAVHEKHQNNNTPNQQRASSPADIHAELPITPEEARFGAVCSLRLTWLGPCDRCHATGSIDRTTCSACDGAGMRRHQSPHMVQIPARSRTALTLQIRGRGNFLPGAMRRGDLYLHIAVRPCW